MKDDVEAFKVITDNKNVEVIRVDKSLMDATIKASNEWAAKQSAGVKLAGKVGGVTHRTRGESSRATGPSSNSIARATARSGAVLFRRMCRKTGNAAEPSRRSRKRLS